MTQCMPNPGTTTITDWARWWHLRMEDHDVDWNDVDTLFEPHVQPSYWGWACACRAQTWRHERPVAAARDWQRIMSHLPEIVQSNPLIAGEIFRLLEVSGQLPKYRQRLLQVVTHAPRKRVWDWFAIGIGYWIAGDDEMAETALEAGWQQESLGKIAFYGAFLSVKRADEIHWKKWTARIFASTQAPTFQDMEMLARQSRHMSMETRAWFALTASTHGYFAREEEEPSLSLTDVLPILEEFGASHEPEPERLSREALAREKLAALKRLREETQPDDDSSEQS